METLARVARGSPRLQPRHLRTLLGCLIDPATVPKRYVERIQEEGFGLLEPSRACLGLLVCWRSERKGAVAQSESIIQSNTESTERLHAR